jgi:hypothetical protein
MPKFSIVIAKEQPDSGGLPYLVRDPLHLGRYVGVAPVACPNPPAQGATKCGCPHAAAHWKPAKMLVQHDAHFAREAATLTTVATTDAKNIASARAALAKEMI